MIKILLETHDGAELYCPRFICDACQLPIDNGGMARYIWPVNLASGQPVEGQIFIVHKGRCGDYVDQHIKRAGYTPYWDELSKLFEYLKMSVTQAKTPHA